jgi:hypothetical protein
VRRSLTSRRRPTGVGAFFLFASDFINSGVTGRPWLSFHR